MVLPLGASCAQSYKQLPFSGVQELARESGEQWALGVSRAREWSISEGECEHTRALWMTGVTVGWIVTTNGIGALSLEPQWQLPGVLQVSGLCLSPAVVLLQGPGPFSPN